MATDASIAWAEEINPATEHTMTVSAEQTLLLSDMSAADNVAFDCNTIDRNTLLLWLMDHSVGPGWGGGVGELLWGRHCLFLSTVPCLCFALYTTKKRLFNCFKLTIACKLACACLSLSFSPRSPLSVATYIFFNFFSPLSISIVLSVSSSLFLCLRVSLSPCFSLTCLFHMIFKVVFEDLMKFYDIVSKNGGIV